LLTDMTMRSISLGLAAFALSTLPDVAMGQSAGSSAYADDRINQLGRSIADLQSRTEQLRKQNQQLQQQMDKMRSNYESRLERLEKGGSAKAPSPRPTQPRP
jgi:TolA-binding protein